MQKTDDRCGHERLRQWMGMARGRYRGPAADSAYGIIKWNKSYKRAHRKGLENIILEFTLIACGFNLHKYHNKKNRKSIEKCA